MTIIDAGGNSNSADLKRRPNGREVTKTQFFLNKKTEIVRRPVVLMRTT